jgi:endo-1,4-beta-xylanase
LGTRHFVWVLGALGAACSGPTAAIPGYAHQVVVAPPRATLVPGDTIRLAAIGPSHTINWNSLNRGVATVDSFGTVRAVALGVALIVAAGGDSGTSADTATVAVDPPLRSLAGAHHLQVGVAVDMNAFHSDALYRQKLAAEYSSVTPEWVMKFATIHPGPNRYSFDAADSLVSFALANGMAVHGHTLVWGEALPQWITGGTFTRDQLLQLLKDHIATVVGRYRGTVATWDVVNEVVDDTVPLRNTLWLKVIGPAYIDSAFVWAHRADPAAKLYLNETHAEGLNAKSNATLTLVQGLRARAVPIDGVGFQAHFTLTPPPPSAADLAANLARFVSAGFDVRVSEMDVRIADGASSSALDQQAAVYRDMLDACLQVSPHCVAFTTWGFTDRHSWIPKFYPGFGRALPFDASYGSKPAYTALLTRLQQP